MVNVMMVPESVNKDIKNHRLEIYDQLQEVHLSQAEFRTM